MLNSVCIAADNCSVSFIIPNTLLDGAQFSVLRKTLSEIAIVKNIRDYRDLAVFGEANVQTMIILLSKSHPVEAYTTPYVYWDRIKFQLEQLVINISSNLPWRLQNIVTHKISKLGLCVPLESDIGTCHDAGVDYKWKDIGWQNRGEKTKISDLIFYSGERQTASDYPLLKGNDIDRYSLNFDNNWLIHDFAKYKTRESVVLVYLDLALVPVKILTRQTSDHIQASLDYGQYVTAKSIHTTLVKAMHYNPIYVVAVLNSRLISYIYQLQTGEAGRLFPQVKLYDFRQLPIRSINFITSDKDRAFYLEKAKLLYNQCMSKDDQDCVLGFVNYHLSQEPEASDIVHDLLAFLAEEMLRLNKEKRAAQRVFLDWLVDTLNIQPQADKDGKVGIDSLKHKAKLLDYPGDYQKDEDALEFADIKSILLENKKRLLVPLNEALLAKVEERYQQSLDTVLPLKRQLALTDKLIDRVVYRLYDLTEEEIRVVEGQA
jgi:hypothetical protein